MKFHHRMFSRKVILGTAMVLAVTGATGAAAVLAPSDLGLSRFIPAVTAQLVAPDTNNDVFAQLPFERITLTPGANDLTQPSFDQVAQAPITTPSTSLTGAPTSAPIASAPAAPAPVAQGPAARTNRAPGRVAQSPAARGPAVRDPAAQGPIAQAPDAQAPTAAPQGRAIMTSSPGVIVGKQQIQTKIVTPVKHIVRPRAVYVELCNE